jgi:hypothetical protein
MRSVVRNLLVFAVGVLLALPPGWCCMLVAVSVQAPKPARADCCAKCCAQPQAPAGEETPPGPAPLTVCCCDNLVPLHKNSAKSLPDAAELPLPFVAEPAARVERPTAPAAEAVSPRCSLHVLLCVWRC